jgi:hypothetical protein
MPPVLSQVMFGGIDASLHKVHAHVSASKSQGILAENDRIRKKEVVLALYSLQIRYQKVST